MKAIFKQFCTASVALVLVVAIMAPAVLKLSHGLFEHHNLVCLDESTSHVHQTELDCEFQKFKLSPQTYTSFAETTEIELLYDSNNYYNYYTFLSNFKKLPFALRGPPALS